MRRVLAGSRSWNRKLFTHVRISTVRSGSRLHRASILVLAFLVFLGAAAPAFANRACAPVTVKCEPVAGNDKDGCCPCHESEHKSRTPQSRDCCTICPSFNSLAAHVASAVVLTPFEIAIVPHAIVIPDSNTIRMSAKIPSLADNSPPKFVDDPNFGRAPPIA